MCLAIAAISFALALLASVLLLTVENLLGNFLFMFSLSSVVLGVYLIVIQGRLLALLPPDAQTVLLIAALFPCILVVIVGTLGIFTCGRPKMIITFMIAASCLAVVLMSFGAMVMCRDSLPESWQARLDILSDPQMNASTVEIDDQNLAELASALGARTTWNIQEISIMFEANQTAVGLALIVMAAAVIVFVLPVAGWTLKLSRARIAARKDSNNGAKGKYTTPPRKPRFRVGKDWAVDFESPLSPPRHSKDDSGTPNSPPMVEMVEVLDNHGRQSYISPKLPQWPRQTPSQRSPPSLRLPPSQSRPNRLPPSQSRVQRPNRRGVKWSDHGRSWQPPPPPPGTPPTCSEDGVIFFSKKKPGMPSMSEDDWSPEHRSATDRVDNRSRKRSISVEII